MINFTDLSGITFTAWPEMLAWPYLMLNGWLPYRDIAIAHNPLLLIDLAIFYKLFGIGVVQLKVYTWVLIAINIWLIYLVSKKFWNMKIGLLSSFIYLLFCVVYEGNGLWFDLALTPFALLLFLFFKEKKYLLMGIFFSLGFLTKQTFIYFLIPIVFTKFSKIEVVNIKKFTLGCLYIFLPFLVILLCLGIADDFYKWTIEFGIFYLPNATGQLSFPSIKSFLFAIVPFSILKINYELALWAIVGMLGTYPRWELFHFQPALPFVAIALSVFLYSKRNRFFKTVVLVLGVFYIIYGLNRQAGAKTRFVEPEVVKIAQSIKELGPKEIYVVNYWDNLYALTKTQPPKPLIPYIPWYLSFNNNRDIIINRLKVNAPEVVVIGERDNNFLELYQFVDKFYSCNIVDRKVELCHRN